MIGHSLLATAVLLILACAVPFEPAECDRIKGANLTDFLYRDILRGEEEGECYRIYGEILHPIGSDGYRIGTGEYGLDDIFLYWQGEEPLVEGDVVEFVGMVVKPFTYETVLGAERTIPAFHGANIKRLR